MIFTQSGADIRCEWGLRGVGALVSVSDAIIIVDVLSFTTCVDIATARGATIYPYAGRGDDAAGYAQSVDAVLASHHRTATTGYSLAPSSLIAIPGGTRLVLPSPNGSTLSLATGDVPTFAGCLRNAEAVAAKASAIGPRISVIAAGERWPDGSLRVSLEDMIGAGAIIHHLTGKRSPEAQVTEQAFLHVYGDLDATLRECASARELVERGFAADVDLALQLNVSPCAPCLIEGAYRNSA